MFFKQQKVVSVTVINVLMSFSPINQQSNSQMTEICWRDSGMTVYLISFKTMRSPWHCQIFATSNTVIFLVSSILSNILDSKLPSSASPEISLDKMKRPISVLKENSSSPPQREAILTDRYPQSPNLLLSPQVGQGLGWVTGSFPLIQWVARQLLMFQGAKTVKWSKVITFRMVHFIPSAH